MIAARLTPLRPILSLLHLTSPFLPVGLLSFLKRKLLVHQVHVFDVGVYVGQFLLSNFRLGSDALTPVLLDNNAFDFAVAFKMLAACVVACLDVVDLSYTLADATNTLFYFEPVNTLACGASLWLSIILVLINKHLGQCFNLLILLLLISHVSQGLSIS